MIQRLKSEVPVWHKKPNKGPHWLQALGPCCCGLDCMVGLGWGFWL